MHLIGNTPRLALVYALAFFAASSVSAQDAARAGARASAVARYRNRLLGAYDEQSGEPIQGVEVIDVASGTTAVTTKTGTVSLAFLSDGASLVRLRKVGFVPVNMSVSISVADTTPLTVVMKRSAQELPAVVTRDSARRYIAPGLQGFEERRRAGFGHFIDDSTLRAAEGSTMAFMLARLPGATLKGGHLVSTRTPTKGPALLHPTPGLNCPASVYLDGVLLTSSPDFSREATDTYAGVEFYASSTTAPVWISSANSQCGVLLLWTRER
jgi:hypothetical protein